MEKWKPASMRRTGFLALAEIGEPQEIKNFSNFKL